MKLYLVLILICFGEGVFAQKITGHVTDQNNEALPGAIIRWAVETTEAVSTDSLGFFEIAKNKTNNKLVVSYVGFITDTLLVKSTEPLKIKLSNTQFKEVTVKANPLVVDELSAIQTETITTRELAKAPCCNLSESFETNASVNVSYSDALTGARQIEMLGLSGKYVETQIEDVPAIRGLATTFGLSHIPGTWLQSIDIGKGSGSVINGHESMSGAMKVELWQPNTSDRVYANVFVNSLGRTEVNLNLKHKLNKRWSTGLLTHYSFLKNEVDRNEDGFLDTPTYSQINVLNRWNYVSDKWVSKFGVRAMKENRDGGNPGVYKFSNKTERIEAFAKNAKLFQNKPYMGLGLIVNGVIHNDNSIIGENTYEASQQSAYGNLIYQNILGDTRHSYKLGASLVLDDYTTRLNAINLDRIDVVPGVFAEYTYNNLDKFIFVAGIRQDNVYSIEDSRQISPRVHLKYTFDDHNHNTIRLSAGKGFRIANPIAENYGMLISNREVEFLQPFFLESSWSYGVSYNYHKNKISWITDLYYTNFEEQLIADRETPGRLTFYTSKGTNYSVAAQTELGWAVNSKLSLKAAYRYTVNKQSFGKDLGETVLLDKPFLPKNRFFINAHYALPYNKWAFDATLNIVGKQRLPEENLFSPSFTTMSAQINRNYTNWEYYIGSENLTNFRQANPVLFANEPTNPLFDGSMVWGPVVGRTIYLGIRYKLK